MQLGTPPRQGTARPARRRRLWRVLLVAALPMSLCMCMATQRNPRTTVAMGGSYSDVSHRDYGCGAEILGEQRHLIEGGQVAVEHDTGGSLHGGMSAGAERGRIASSSGSLAGTDNQGWSQWNTGVWAGGTFRHFAFDAGGFYLHAGYNRPIGATSDHAPLFGGRGLGGYWIPHLALRGGKLDGVYGELKLYSKRFPVDPSLLTASVHFVRDDLHLHAASGLFGRVLPAATPPYGPGNAPQVIESLASYAKDADTGLALGAEYWLDRHLGVRVEGFAARNWFAGVWLLASP